MNEIEEFVEEENSQKIYYDDIGQKYLENEKADSIICAKEVHNNRTNKNGFYVLCNGGELYDPRKKDARYHKKHWKLKRTKYTTFELYLRYLQTKRKVFLYNAEREI